MSQTVGRRTLLLALVVLLVAVACVAGKDHHPIPDGVYRAESGGDSITISGRRIRFQLHDTSPSRRGRFEKEYDYTVLPDGAIQPFPMASNDAFYYGYGWFWDGTAISRRDPKEVGDPVIFSRQ